MKISYGVEPTGVKTRYFPRGMTDVLRGDDVGRSEKVCHADQDKMFKALRHAHAKGNAFCAIFFLDAVQIICGELECLFP